MGLRVYTFKMEEREMEVIDRLARQLRKTRSDVIREALQIWLSNYGYGGVRVEQAIRVRRVVLGGE